MLLFAFVTGSSTQAQDDPLGYFLLQTQLEMLDAIFQVMNEQNAQNRKTLFVVGGSMTFGNFIETETNIASPLPELSDGIFAFQYVPDSIRRPLLFELVTDKLTSEDRSAAFKVDNAIIFIEAVLYLGTELSGTKGSERTQPAKNVPALPAAKAQGDAADKGFIFSGFDHLVSGSNSLVIVNGISADCGEQCFDLEDSKILLINSDLACEDDCIRLDDAGAGPDQQDFDELRSLLTQGSLTNKQRARILAATHRYQSLLQERDAVISDSQLASSSEALVVSRSDFEKPSARVLIEDSYLGTSSTGSKAVNLQTASERNLIMNSVIDAADSRTDALTFTYGNLDIKNSWVRAGEQGVNITDGDARFTSSSFSLHSAEPEQVCDATFGSDEFASGGFNVVADDSCQLNAQGDQQSTATGLKLSAETGFANVEPDAPELDAGAAEISDGVLPCSGTDMTGLPRPQDGNSDGIAECDIGPVEKQAGGDIDSPQTGTYFDLNRDGEGIFVEILPDGEAAVYLFSYRPDGSAFWALGRGTVDRNGIVISKSDFFTTSGPTFGDQFDPADLILTEFADFAMSLPGCTDGPDAGVLSIAANDELGFPPMMGRTSALSRIMDCSFQPAGAGFSGTFFDLSHNGEGIVVQIIAADTAVVIWYTYDSMGNQTWILGVGELSGDTITVANAFTRSGPGYGPEFDPADAIETAWGTFSVKFSDDCDGADFNYNSSLPEFGSGSQDMIRLTRPQDIVCTP